MTQQGNWQQEIARLAQRQDQLERQHRETTTRVDTLKGDADASKMDVDSSIDSLRREIDSQFREREWRVKSLERWPSLSPWSSLSSKSEGPTRRADSPRSVHPLQ